MKNLVVTFAAKILNKIAQMTDKERTPQGWDDLSVKDKAALVTACVSFGLGFVLLFVGMFIDPAGEIDASVITAFGTALLYAAGIFGVAMYFKNGSNELMNGIIEKMEDMIEKKIKADEQNKK